jgi:hypothetical protein
MNPTAIATKTNADRSARRNREHDAAAEAMLLSKAKTDAAPKPAPVPVPAKPGAEAAPKAAKTTETPPKAKETPAPVAAPKGKRAKAKQRAKARAEMGPAAALGASIRRDALHLQAVAERLVEWHPPTELNTSIEIVKAVRALEIAADALAKVPASWRPVAPAIAEGSTVDIRAGHRKAYDGLLDAADLVGMKVVKIAGGRCVCRTKSGTPVVGIPLSFLVLAGK